MNPFQAQGNTSGQQGPNDGSFSTLLPSSLFANSILQPRGSPEHRTAAPAEATSTVTSQPTYYTNDRSARKRQRTYDLDPPLENNSYNQPWLMGSNTTSVTPGPRPLETRQLSVHALPRRTQSPKLPDEPPLSTTETQQEYQLPPGSRLSSTSSEDVTESVKSEESKDNAIDSIALVGDCLALYANTPPLWIGSAQQAEAMKNEMAHVYQELNLAWQEHSHYTQQLQALHDTIQALTRRLFDCHRALASHSVQSGSFLSPPSFAQPSGSTQGSLHRYAPALTTPTSANHGPQVHRPSPYTPFTGLPSAKQTKLSYFSASKPGTPSAASAPMSSRASVSSPRPNVPKPAIDTDPQVEQESSQGSSRSTPEPKVPSPRPLSGRARSAQIAVATSKAATVLQTVESSYQNKVLCRKPRCLLTHPIAGISDSGHKFRLDLMTTNTLDGNVQFWNVNTKEIIEVIPPLRLKMPWAEDMTWVDDTTMLVASAYKEGESEQNQLSLLYLHDVHSSGFESRIRSLHVTPHERGVGAITAIDCTSDRLRFATGGNDKRIVLWSCPRAAHASFKLNPPQQINWKPRHTAAVQALCYVPHRSSLLSGGADGRFFMQNLDKAIPSLEFKYADRISHILMNPVDPNLVLLSMAATSQQMRLIDLRMRSNSVLRFGFSQPDKLSRYIEPNFHPSGHLVSCGRHLDGRINLWDIRYAGVEKGVTQSVSLMDKRVVKALFHPTRQQLIAMSTDGSVAFLRYQLRESILDLGGSDG
ncbi:hypothetical protein H4R34_002153 [Dimargaris verticillata]|uniref:WD40 repeat-like protein n=1 Tax=Dimargaris verticillata TaxID=2761393 RepID=A0A9W8ED54_9FUNG|nr:hypothetical protein H4R34_002153 [Dimargaris verticillata]